MAKKTVSVSMRIPPTTRDRLTALASRTLLSQATLIDLAIEALLELAEAHDLQITIPLRFGGVQSPNPPEQRICPLSIRLTEEHSHRLEKLAHATSLPVSKLLDYGILALLDYADSRGGSLRVPLDYSDSSGPHS